MIMWEEITDSIFNAWKQARFEGLYRAKVPGGWLILLRTSHVHNVINFYPNQNHEWDGSSPK